MKDQRDTIANRFLRCAGPELDPWDQKDQVEDQVDQATAELCQVVVEQSQEGKHQEERRQEDQQQEDQPWRNPQKVQQARQKVGWIRVFQGIQRARQQKEQPAQEQQELVQQKLEQQELEQRELEQQELEQREPKQQELEQWALVQGPLQAEPRGQLEDPKVEWELLVELSQQQVP